MPEVTDVTNVQEQDAIDLLLDQHTQIKVMFGRVAQAQGPQRRALFEDLVRMIAVHEIAEEEIVHPIARMRLEGGEEIVERRLQEESAATQALADLYDVGIDDSRFDSMLAALADDLLEHNLNEETEEFRYLRQSLTDEQLERMTATIKATEAMAPIRPHPAAGPASKGAKAATADMMDARPIEMFDRLRTAVHEWSTSTSG
jgi:hemerythrin superfamily protein